MRLRVLGALVGSSTILISAGAPPAALGDSSGGTSPAESPAPAAPASPPPAAPASLAPPAAPRSPLHLSPVTTRAPRLVSYHGPLYQKTAAGEVIPYQPLAPAGLLGGATGGSPVRAATATKPELLVPGSIARYVDGVAAAPMAAPEAVQQAIWSANQIIGLPYVYGGGHSSFAAGGYDCSGTVSFALHGGSLLATPLDSSEFMLWGSHGVGRWITTFANPGHAYVDIAGLRLDTSAADDPSRQQGPRWRPLRQANSGYTVRHPLSY